MVNVGLDRHRRISVGIRELVKAMWYQPAALIADKRDVIGAWILCLAVALAFFGYPAVIAIDQ